MILAKSDGVTLHQHIIDCLCIFSELKKSLPKLPDISHNKYFWDHLFYAVCFHDIGKIHSEFQKVLTGKRSEWNNQRHEIYSVAFSHKLILKKEKHNTIQRAILAHHKTFDELKQKYKSHNEIKQDMEIIYDKNKFHPEDFTENLKRFFPLESLQEIFDCLYKLANDYKIPFNLRRIIYAEIANPIEQFVLNYEENPAESSEYFNELFLWGALKICDHYGSAGIKKIYTFDLPHFSFLERLHQSLLLEGTDFYNHQLSCFDTVGNVILIAPTGSGKTEAAIGWLQKQWKQVNGRAFYVLPYTASINAMHNRLIKDMEGLNDINQSRIVGIEHGKLAQYLLSHFEQNDSVLIDRILNLKDNYRRLIYPLKIVTPFQILKHFYGVKGFELGLTQLAGAKLIFDEIHAYDTTTYAQILLMLKYLVKYYQASVFVLTATLPSYMQKELSNALGGSKIIRADDELTSHLKRHKIKIIQGNIFDNLYIINDHLKKGKRVIIVCNSVQQSQQVYQEVLSKKILPSKKWCCSMVDLTPLIVFITKNCL